MVVKFTSTELPVAYSMIRAARRLRKRNDGFHPFEKYIYYWTAFNNIYTTIAYSGGRHTTLKFDANGRVETKQNGSVLIPQVDTIREREQIKLAIEEFDVELRHQLITHPNTIFFVQRNPSWEGNRIARDIRGQMVNGVINVNYTISTDYPVWSPIDVAGYNHYLNNQHDDSARKLLTRQIVDVLYHSEK